MVSDSDLGKAGLVHRPGGGVGRGADKGEESRSSALDVLTVRGLFPI